ncbi:MAG: hypothetical protein KGJ90_06325 [Patescibacteria group bacterium]|nr:hypothetical protein [Patescibacteria group bacterium]
MAGKRMFCKEVVHSDQFLEMPASTQALYFHLGMEADDDGFLGSPKKIIKTIGAAEDDLKILLTKRFVLAFPSGILVIKHHRMNNNWDKYNCKRTVYLEEFNQLHIKENRAYTLDISQGIPVQSDYSLKTVSRIEENRIDKNRLLPAKADFHFEEENPKEPRAKKDPLTEKYEQLVQWGEHRSGVKVMARKKQYAALKSARLAEITPDRLKARWQELETKKFHEENGLDWGMVVSSFDRKA